MFLKTSRYSNTETLTTTDARKREVKAIKLRRLPELNGDDMMIVNGSQLDVMSKQQYRDGTRFWHIADANTELEANALVQTSGRKIKTPKP
ncbi:MAG: hypothetical protein GY819_13090 [Planctomycetaceae bacterium]|nr:hypothetical protein [Planctomycetaceae bacterium]